MQCTYHTNWHTQYTPDRNQVHLALVHPNFQNMVSKAHNFGILFHIDHKQFDIPAFQAAEYWLFCPMHMQPSMIKIW